MNSDFYGSDWRGHYDAFAWVREVLEDVGAIANAHCDNLVLHKPGDCHYCDKYAETAQRQRGEYKIPFAGEPGAPETIFRPAETVTKWSGNVGVKKGELHSHMGATYIVGTCGSSIAPEGWFCTRDDGHDGPCAAVPTYGDLVRVSWPKCQGDGSSFCCTRNGCHPVCNCSL